MAESREYRKLYKRLKEAQESLAEAEEAVNDAQGEWYSAAESFNELLDSDDDFEAIGVEKVDEDACCADDCYSEWDNLSTPDSVDNDLTDLEEEREEQEEEEPEDREVEDRDGEGEREVEIHGDIRL